MVRFVFTILTENIIRPADIYIYILQNITPRSSNDPSIARERQRQRFRWERDVDRIHLFHIISAPWLDSSRTLFSLGGFFPRLFPDFSSSFPVFGFFDLIRGLANATRRYAISSTLSIPVDRSLPLLTEMHDRAIQRRSPHRGGPSSPPSPPSILIDSAGTRRGRPFRERRETLLGSATGRYDS